MPAGTFSFKKTWLDEDGETTLHECNDCEAIIPDWLPICAKCEQWYDERGIKVPV